MDNPVALLREIEDGDRKYNVLIFWCPGCETAPSDDPEGMQGGLHMLAVSGDVVDRPKWTFDGNLEAPTLHPSIKTSRPPGKFVCHSFLRNGVFEFLADCTHKHVGQHVPLPPLPDWVINE